MIEVLDGMPEGVIGLRATGHVTGEEYKDVLLPAMKEQVEGGEVRLVFVLGPGFERFEAGALAQDTKAGVTLGLGHLHAWKRCALVTDEDWILKAWHAFAWMAPGEVATFGLDEVNAAAEWAAG
jgi:hypothetical protein